MDAAKEEAGGETYGKLKDLYEQMRLLLVGFEVRVHSQ